MNFDQIKLILLLWDDEYRNKEYVDAIMGNYVDNKISFKIQDLYFTYNLNCYSITIDDNEIFSFNELYYSTPYIDDPSLYIEKAYNSIKDEETLYNWIEIKYNIHPNGLYIIAPFNIIADDYTETRTYSYSQLKDFMKHKLTFMINGYHQSAYTVSYREYGVVIRSEYLRKLTDYEIENYKLHEVLILT